MVYQWSLGLLADDAEGLNISEKGYMPVQLIGLGFMYFCAAKLNQKKVDNLKIKPQQIARDLNKESTFTPKGLGI